MERLFGTDGIRGKANDYPMDITTAALAGKAIANHVRESLQANDLIRSPFIVIGQDTRISGDMLAHAVASGICSAGLDVSLLGVLPTPAVAQITASTQAAAGIVISASHNPFADNGIKVFDSQGFKLSDEIERRIETIIDQETFSKTPSKAIGRTRVIKDPIGHYIDYLQSALPELDLKGMTIVLDCANGATWQVAPELFKRIGATVVPLYCSPDGTNINEACGSQFPEKLTEAVTANQAAIGLAFDGDGDRLIAVDETGSILTGDQIIAICARDLKESKRLWNNTVVTTVMSNIGFHQAMKRLGIQTFRTDVGDRYVMQKMLIENAVIGGEDSGHIIFRDIHTTGDGLAAALRLIDVMRRNNASLSHLSEIMTVYPQVLINVPVRAKPRLSDISAIRNAIAAVEQDLGDHGRVLVRYSGTQNKCRIMVEGPTSEKTQAHCRKIAEIVRNAIGDD